MSWLLARKSKLSLEKDSIIQMYPKTDLDIWNSALGLTQPSNTKVLQRFQSNVLRSITNAPWYVSKLTLHKDLQIPFVTEEINKYSTIYHSRLIQHENNHVTELSNPLHVKRRLRRQWPSDLTVERGEEEKRCKTAQVTVYIGESSLDYFSAQVLTHNTFTYYSTVEWIVNLRRKIRKN
jgi:hypothetical protein